MTPSLPIEIITKIIETAALRSASPALTNQYTYHPTLLANLCLVSRSFYSLSAALLYREIIVHKDICTALLIPKLLPLLSRSQRLQLAAEATPQERLNIEALQHKERIADPAWVRRLVIFNVRPSRPGEENIPWRYLEEAMRGMKNLRSVTWEPESGSLHLAEMVASLPNLAHVSCAATSLLCAPHLEQLFNGVRLKSITALHIGGYDPENIGGLRNLIRPSAGSLESLHLCFHGLRPSEIDSRVTSMLKDVESLPMLQHLRLGGYELSTIETLEKVVDFRALKTLQLVRDGVCPELSRALRRSGGLPGITKLSAVLVPSEAVEVISQCKELREIHIVYESDEDPMPMEKPVERLLEVVGRHGRTLRALSLFVGYKSTEREEMDLGTREVEMLVKGCSELEDLRINIVAKEFVTISSILPRLRHLRHLCLDLEDRPTPSPLNLAGTGSLIPLSAPWYDPDEIGCPPSQVSMLEYALYHLLSASTSHHPLPWRRHTPLSYISISSTGVDPSNPSKRFSQSYLLREESLPCTTFISTDDEDDDAGVYWGTPYIAPSGQRFAFENNGPTRIVAEVVGGFPAANLAWMGRLGKWATAFKQSGTMVRWERAMVQS